MVISLHLATSWRRRNGESSSKIPSKATAHIAQWVEKLTCSQEVTGLNPAGEQICFSENQYLLHALFLKFSFDMLLLGIPSMHWNGTWEKLNASHLGTRLWWLLMDIFFCWFFTARWRYWCKEKTGNRCGTFLSKPRRQTVVNQLSCGLNPSQNQTYYDPR